MARSRSSRCVWLAAVFAGLCLPGVAPYLQAAVDEPAPAKPSDFPNTPEGACKNFILAVIAGDEASLRRLTLPADGFEWLMAGEHATAEQVAAIRKHFETMKVRQLKPGEEITLPGGRKLIIQPEEVTDERAVVLPEDDKVPTRLQKVMGVWRVDARPVIAGRRAADAARKRKEAEEKQKSKEDQAGK